MTTAQFSRMYLPPRDRTKITTVQAAVKAYFLKCKTVVTPVTISAACLSRPLDKCPVCNTVIQRKAGVAKAKRAKPRTDEDLGTRQVISGGEVIEIDKQTASQEIPF